jgi:hypothetical protein
VERLSNTGFFGSGQFTDQSNIDVVPALGVACLLLLLLIAGAVRRAAPRHRAAPVWLRGCASASSDRHLPKLLPAVFALQLAVLWSMETLEQIVVAGHPLAGTIWLGGPVLFSLLAHALGCVVLTWALARTVRWSAQTIVEVVALICELLCGIASAHVAPRRRALELAAHRFLEPLLARLTARAPPFLPTNTHIATPC